MSVSRETTRIILTRGNYLAWSCSIEVQLRAKQRWIYVCPIDQMGAVEENAAGDNHKKGRLEALDIIIRTLSEKPMLLVRRHRDDPRKVWDTLASNYLSMGVQERAVLEERLSRVYLRGKRDQDLEQFFFEFEERLLRFEEAGGDLTQEQLVIKLLQNLPADYEHTAETILSGSEITLEKAKTALRRRQMRLNGKKQNGRDDNNRHQEQALKARSNYKGNKRRFRGKC